MRTSNHSCLLVALPNMTYRSRNLKIDVDRNRIELNLGPAFDRFVPIRTLQSLSSSKLLNVTSRSLSMLFSTNYLYSANCLYNAASGFAKGKSSTLKEAARRDCVD